MTKEEAQQEVDGFFIRAKAELNIALVMGIVGLSFVATQNWQIAVGLAMISFAHIVNNHISDEKNRLAGRLRQSHILLLLETTQLLAKRVDELTQSGHVIATFASVLRREAMERKADDEK